MTTYTSSLRMILPDSGALVNTWGTVLNASLINLIDSSIAGYTSITMSLPSLPISSLRRLPNLWRPASTAAAPE